MLHSYDTVGREISESELVDKGSLQYPDPEIYTLITKGFFIVPESGSFTNIFGAVKTIWQFEYMLEISGRKREIS